MELNEMNYIKINQNNRIGGHFVAKFDIKGKERHFILHLKHKILINII